MSITVRTPYKTNKSGKTKRGTCGEKHGLSDIHSRSYQDSFRQTVQFENCTVLDC